MLSSLSNISVSILIHKSAARSPARSPALSRVNASREHRRQQKQGPKWKQRGCEWNADGNQQQRRWERWKKKEWLKRQKEAFRSQLRVMPCFVSQPQGPIYVCLSREAGDAFNTAVSGDTDTMRQTVRNGVKGALCRKMRRTACAI